MLVESRNLRYAGILDLNPSLVIKTIVIAITACQPDRRQVPEQNDILVNITKPTAVGPDAGDVVLVVEREVVALIGVEAEIVAEACEVPVRACVDVAVFTFLEMVN